MILDKSINLLILNFFIYKILGWRIWSPVLFIWVKLCNVYDTKKQFSLFIEVMLWIYSLVGFMLLITISLELIVYCSLNKL